MPQVVQYFIAVMYALLVLPNRAKPCKFSQIAAAYILFRLRRMEMLGGALGGLKKGAKCVDVWIGYTRPSG